MNTPMRIVVAYDRSSAADDALDELVRAGLPDNAHALVLSVAEPWPVPIPSDGGLHFPEPLLADQESAGEAARLAGDRLRKDFPGWTIAAEGVTGSVTQGILARAEAWGANLIVVGSRGRNLPGRSQFGSISQQIATSAHCSVRVSRDRQVSRLDPVRLLAAVDGSPDAERVLHEILHRPWPPHTKVWLVTAVGAHATVEDDEGDRRRAETLHADAIAQLHERGIAGASILEAIDPKHAILFQARELDVDSILIGARGLTRYERSLLGSISASVAARAACSVEIVRG